MSRLDPLAGIRADIRKIFRLLASRSLENSSVKDGMMRFIRGVLRLEQQSVLDGEGTFNWAGPASIRGPVNITGESGTLAVAADASFSGDVSIEETLDVSATTTLRGALQLLADLLVKTGGRIVLEGSPGVQIIPGSGSTPARIRLGTTSGDPVLQGGTGITGLVMPDMNTGVTVGAGGVSVGYGLGELGGWEHSIGVGSTGIRINGMDDLPAGVTALQVVLGSNGILYTWAGGTGGGPGDGVFAWPFSLDLVTSEFRSASRPDHDGIDFGSGIANIAGTPIPSAGAGVVKTILAPGQGHGWGNGVIVDHGTDPLYGGASVETLYAHMSTAPVVALGAPIALGQTLGPIGNTGNSFGNHLHYEVHVDGAAVNPRTFHAAHGG